jgi:hypothetical protein
MADKNSLSREIFLILIGAIISATTAFLTNHFNERRELRRMNIQKRLELNDQISKDLGKRLFITREIYKKRRDKDATINISLSEYQKIKEDWNLKIFSYRSLLSYYYGQSVQSDFIRNIYNPLIELGQKAEYNLPDSTFEQKYSELREKDVAFISKIYALTEEF